MQNILITGSSGFIGFHLAKKLVNEGFFVVGFDNENDYYDIKLKHDRRKILQKYNNFKFYKGDLSNLNDIKKIFVENHIEKVVNLAAQVGVRFSIERPFSYIETNILGFHNILFLSNEYKVKKFIYASSSSVYGNNNKQPFSIEDSVNHPISLYAATKKSDELIAHSYSHIYGLPTIGLRFFTVYGPWSRPDMAMLNFAQKISRGKSIDIYNYGKMRRDFTYIDDIVDGIIKSMDYQAQYDVFNLGNDNPVQLEYIIELLEKGLGKKAIKNYLPIQAGDMIETYADIGHTKEKLGWMPTQSIENGVFEFINRFKNYYLLRDTNNNFFNFNGYKKTSNGTSK